MDKTFEDIISEVLEEETAEGNTNTPEEEVEETEETETTEDETEDDVESEEDETEDDEESEEVEETEDDSEEDVIEDEEDEVSNSSSVNSKDAEAFARMRKEIKDLKQYYDFFDGSAKQMGFKDIDELITKTNEANIAKQAKEQGLPVEVIKKINDLELEVAQQKAEKEAERKAAEDEHLSQVLNAFTQANKLSNEDTNKLAKDLIADGITLEVLKTMPDSFINKALRSYVSKDLSKQKLLEKKEKIKKEVPSGVKTNGSKVSKEDEIDSLVNSILNRK